MDREEAKIKFGQRIQRCYGCYGAFYMKDMWLGPDATYYCEECKDDTMFHFDEFTEKMDFSKLPGSQSGEDETSQCQSPFTRQV